MALRKIKNGKAPGLTGWTKELFSIVANTASKRTQRLLSLMFTDLCNVSGLHPTERRMLFAGRLCPLAYNDVADKLRPIIIFEFINKLMWRITLTLPEDELLTKTSTQVFAKSGSCSIAAHILHHCTENGIPVVALDAKNAFNTLDRKVAFEYVRAKPQIYKQAYNILNAAYTSPSVVFWRVAGRPPLSLKITTGTMQGCVSGMWFYMRGTLPLNIKRRSHLLQAADDMFVIGEEGMRSINEVHDDLKGINQCLEVSKCRYVFDGAPFQRDNTKIAGAKVHKALGVYVGRSLNAAERKLIINEFRAKVMNFYARIAEMDTTLQNKWLMMLHSTFRWLYHVENAKNELYQDFAAIIDQAQISTFNKLFGVQLQPGHLVLVFYPVQDGGLGLAPYELLADTIRHTARSRARECAETLQIHLPVEPLKNPHSSIREAWLAIWKTHAFSTPKIKSHRTATRYTHHNLPAFTSYLTIAPSNLYTTFTNEEFRFAVQHRLAMLTPRPKYCPAQEVCLGSLAVPDYNHHIFACTSCASAMYHIRHSELQAAVHSVFKYHGMSIKRINDRTAEYANPGNSKGGHDLSLYYNGKEYIIDVTVCKEAAPSEGTYDRMKNRFLKKMETYKHLAGDNTKIVTPIVFSSYGTIYTGTVDILSTIWKGICTDQQLKHDLMTIPQCRLLKATKLAVDRLHANNDSDTASTTVRQQQTTT